MSADNGYIIRVNDAGEYVLQMYFASNDEFPDINAGNAITGKTLDEVVRFYEEWKNENAYVSEYGLVIDLSNEKKEVKKSMDIQKFVRRPFAVRGVQVTEENIHEVSEWVGGEVKLNGAGKQYIQVDVKHALNDKQKQAFIGDWVLNTKKGNKVYMDRAFKANFRAYDEPAPEARREVYLNVTTPPSLASDATLEQAQNLLARLGH